MELEEMHGWGRPGAFPVTLGLAEGLQKISSLQNVHSSFPWSPNTRSLGADSSERHRRKRVLVFLFSFLIDLKILAWSFAFCTVQSHESLIRGSKEKHRAVYSLSLYQFPACVSILGPMYRPFQFRDGASSAPLSAPVNSLALPRSLCVGGPHVSIALGASYPVRVGILL